MKGLLQKAEIAAVVAALALAAGNANATRTYQVWSSNEAPNGNYILTITDTGSTNLFNWNLTVNPWNAEALGLFVDLGTATIGAPDTVALTNVVPAGEVVVHATDTDSDGCGEGCKLDGLGSLPSLGGGDWELVFRLARQGYDGIQTFSWTTPDFGLTESSFGVVGIRAQQLCDGTQATLPPNSGCDGSDKVWGNPGTTSTDNGVAEPGMLMLLGFGLMALTVAGRRRA
jgi:hypothetical protein